MVGERTVESRTWDLGDGTFQREQHFGPIHYRDEQGRLVPIDSSLVPTSSTDESASGWVSKANAFQVSIPERFSDGWASIEGSSGAVALRPASGASLGLLEIASSDALQSTSMAPLGLELSLSETMSVPAHLDVSSEALPGRTDARQFGGCFDSADVIYESVARGLKETIVLERYAGSGVFSFDMFVDDVEPSLQPDGSILFRDDAGETVFRMPAPYMWDSREATQGSDPAYSDDVRYEMTQGVLGWRIDIVASSTWLEDPARVYPVHIDPTFYADATAYPAQDTHARSFYPTTNYMAQR